MERKRKRGRILISEGGRKQEVGETQAFRDAATNQYHLKVIKEPVKDNQHPVTRRTWPREMFLGFLSVMKPHVDKPAPTALTAAQGK